MHFEHFTRTQKLHRPLWNTSTVGHMRYTETAERSTCVVYMPLIGMSVLRVVLKPVLNTSMVSCIAAVCTATVYAHTNTHCYAPPLTNRRGH